MPENYTFEGQRVHVGTGWQTLIADLHLRLSELVPGYEVHQIKEKFGGLRYYVGFPQGIDQEVMRTATALITEAEDKSTTICEDCGQPGTTRSIHRWYRTVCDEHERLANERRAALIAEMMEGPDV